ncbi:hypothetical protein [Bryobacter aggregatus]|uniref:hypothetical protein n=1 Tax=Bryobacter aggregatus TaxID=360054 RepID=UPI000AC60A4C|nr:hypothetical protein [Bryobacter aggregatus]
MARPTSQMQDPSILVAALEGLELQKKRIEEQISMVRGLLGGRKAAAPSTTSSSVAAASAPSPSPTRRKRVLSEEARLRIAAAQKKRWAAFRKGKKAE